MKLCVLGWGGFSVYWKIPFFEKKRFIGFAKVQAPKDRKKRKQTKSEIKMLMFQLILAENL
jgi:hypothetical protein